LFYYGIGQKKETDNIKQSSTQQSRKINILGSDAIGAHVGKSSWKSLCV
jgi:hypothetical protein